MKQLIKTYKKLFFILLAPVLVLSVSNANACPNVTLNPGDSVCCDVGRARDWAPEMGVPSSCSTRAQCYVNTTSSPQTITGPAGGTACSCTATLCPGPTPPPGIPGMATYSGSFTVTGITPTPTSTAPTETPTPTETPIPVSTATPTPTPIPGCPVGCVLDGSPSLCVRFGGCVNTAASPYHLSRYLTTAQLAGKINHSELSPFKIGCGTGVGTGSSMNSSARPVKLGCTYRNALNYDSTATREPPKGHPARCIFPDRKYRIIPCS